MFATQTSFPNAFVAKPAAQKKRQQQQLQEKRVKVVKVSASSSSSSSELDDDGSNQALLSRRGFSTNAFGKEVCVANIFCSEVL
jgi:hypothetical protein